MYESHIVSELFKIYKKKKKEKWKRAREIIQP